MNEIICKQCQTSNPPGQKICSACGADLSRGSEILCPNCGTANPPYLPHCIECGTTLLAGEKSSSSIEDIFSTFEYDSESTFDSGDDSSNLEIPSGADQDWLQEFTGSKKMPTPQSGPRLDEVSPDRGDDYESQSNWSWTSTGSGQDAGEEAQDSPPDESNKLKDPSETSDLEEEKFEQEPIPDRESTAYDSENLIEDSDPSWLSAMIAAEKREAGKSVESESDTEKVVSQADQEQEGMLDWVSEVTQKEDWQDEEYPNLVDELDDDDIRLPDTAELPRTIPLGPHHEIEGIPQQLASEEVPDWMAREQPIGRTPKVEIEPEGLQGAEELIPNEMQDDGSQEDLSIEEPAQMHDEALAPSIEESFELDLPPDAPSWLTEIMQDAPTKAELDAAAKGEEVDRETTDQASSFVVDNQDVGDTHSSELDDLTKKAAVVISLDKAHKEDERQSLPEEELISELDSLKGELEEPTLESDWLAMLDELPEIKEPSTSDVDKQFESAESDQGEIPDWLVSLEPQDVALFRDQEERIEAEGPLAGLSSVIPVAAMVTTTRQKGTAGRYTLTKEQQEQVALLKSLTTSPATPQRVTIDDSEKATFFTVRVIISVVLILVILVGWIVPPLDSLLPGTVAYYEPLGTSEAINQMQLLAGRPVLLAFDYPPAYSGEMDEVAKVLLRHLNQQNSPVVTVSTLVTGVPLSDRLVRSVGIDSHLPLGFVSGDAIALRNLGSCLSGAAACESVVGKSLDPQQTETLERVSLIVVLASDRDSLVNWIEQIGTQSNSPMIAGVSQSLGPLALPYLTSGQLSGTLEGLPGARAYASQIAVGDESLSHLASSATLAQWVAIITLIGGSIYFGFEGLVRGRRR